MNYLAHCFLAQPNTPSIVGNLLGDFCKGVDLRSLNQELTLGLSNHRAVDKFTDQHSLVLEAKKCFSPKRRRFAGIALDVLFDHFLIKHWHLYSEQSFEDYKLQVYRLITQGYPLMPEPMQKVMRSVVTNDWFASYSSVEGTCYAIDRIAHRIRFKNNFAGVIEDITRHEKLLENTFLTFFPELKQHIDRRAS